MAYTDERAALTPVMEALDKAVSCLPDASEWKWACLGIRRHMATSVGLRLGVERRRRQPKRAESGIGGLVLSVRTYNALFRAGVSTVAQLEQACGDGTLGSLPRIGPAAVFEIENMLANLHLERMFEGGGE
jgi:DNA-directed RNA polymerase alpha subunit